MFESSCLCGVNRLSFEEEPIVTVGIYPPVLPELEK